MKNTPDYELTPRQEIFVELCESLDLEIDYGYSGRYMYGRECPSVVVDYYEEDTELLPYNSDNMGSSCVFFCP